MSIVDVGNEGYMMEHIVKLEARVQELEAQVISGFYEERAPIFRQGAPRHELESVVTAEEVSGYINRVQELEAQVEDMTQVLMAVNFSEWVPHDDVNGRPWAEARDAALAGKQPQEEE